MLSRKNRRTLRWVSGSECYTPLLENDLTSLEPLACSPPSHFPSFLRSEPKENYSFTSLGYRNTWLKEEPINRWRITHTSAHQLVPSCSGHSKRKPITFPDSFHDLGNMIALSWKCKAEASQPSQHPGLSARRRQADLQRDGSTSF